MRGRTMKNRVGGKHPYWIPIAIMLWLCVRARQVMVVRADCIPATRCTALAYYANTTSSVEQVENLFQVQWSMDSLLGYNDKNQSSVYSGTNLYIPFDCTCSKGKLIHEFYYTVQAGDYIWSVVEDYYHNLTTQDDVCAASNVDCTTTSSNIYPQNILLIPVKCSCGDPSISPDYGLFSTYVVQPTDQLTTIASNFSVNADLISEYNSGVKSLVPYSTIFIPTKNLSGVFPPYSGSISISTSISASSSKTNAGAIAEVVTGMLVLALAVSFLIFL